MYFAYSLAPPGQSGCQPIVHGFGDVEPAPGHARWTHLPQYASPVARSTCGTWRLLRYFQVARLGAVPRLPTIAKTWFCSTSFFTAGTVSAGLYSSLAVRSLILRWKTPPLALTYA